MKKSDQKCFACKHFQPMDPFNLEGFGACSDPKLHRNWSLHSATTQGGYGATCSNFYKKEHVKNDKQ